MSEANLRSVARSCLAPYGAYCRIESPIIPGTPDAIVCIQGNVAWLEYKFLLKRPERKAGRLIVPSLTLDQVNFLMRWHTAGMRSYVLLQVANSYMMLDAHMVKKLYERRYTATGIIEDALVYSSGTFPCSLVVAQIVKPL